MFVYRDGAFLDIVNGVVSRCDVKDTADGAIAIGTYTWIASSAGKRIAIISGMYSSTAALGNITFSSNAIKKWSDNLVNPALGVGSVVLLFNPNAWFISETGQSLVVAANQIFNLQTRWFYFTP